MPRALATTYEPGPTQSSVMRRWVEADAFAAVPDGRGPDERYVIMMPLPNVTGALHMGHAMDNVMQDLLIRWRRMQGRNVLWQPGTDHAGIGTQAVVEKRLLELEGKTRHDIGRDALVERILAWKDEYQQRIVRQQQEMGCSADWKRQRFTMDPVCTRAVREAFFRLFQDGLVTLGDRLVNWDCLLQTAVSDDEVYHETVQGHFWHLRYPVIDPKPGEPTHVTVATTRPETMLGDTAVACHPDPERALETAIEAARAAALAAPSKERAEKQAELERLEARRETHLPTLLRLVEMAKDGRHVMLPLLDRAIPLILDAWAKPELGSGCVKITPAHDPNDHAVWERHRDQIGRINILNPDGTLDAEAGPYAGMDRFEARDAVVSDLEKEGLLEAVEDREVEVGHSERSRSPIEPYLSKQWFVRMGDVEGGVVFGRGTPNEFRAAGLAEIASDAALGSWTSPTGRALAFHPARYLGPYASWLSEKRDWCISRQLWWGHRIPVWSRTLETRAQTLGVLAEIPHADGDGLATWIVDASGTARGPTEAHGLPSDGPFTIQVCLRGSEADRAYAARIEAAGLAQDPDVLDTWFSSACWPFSTLGWPDPETAPVEPGQRALGASKDGPDSFAFYYPGSCLVTGRDIITLWVARMLVFGLYLHGDVPFTDCFVHANILDGKGVRMSKSRGNGIDPVDIIEGYGADAMRYLLADLETGNQDVRLPVQARCPSCEALVELAEARHGKTIFTYLCTACSAEFDVLGTMSDVPPATITSDRFEAGRNFCNKLWNAARFVFLNLGERLEHRPLAPEDLAPEDRWILSRLARAVGRVTEGLEAYAPSTAIGAARDFFWNELCDWYLELVKPRLKPEAAGGTARQVLGFVLDQVLRLLHPFVPFITESLWEHLGEIAPARGIERAIEVPSLLIHAPWPSPRTTDLDEALEAEIDRLQGTIRRLRDLRARYAVPPRKDLPVAIRAPAALSETLGRQAHLLRDQARISELRLGPDAEPPANAATQVFEEMEIFLGGVLDPEKERARLGKERAKLLERIQGGEKRLQNPGFVERAPAKVVEAERTRLEDLRRELELLERNLAAL